MKSQKNNRGQIIKYKFKSIVKLWKYGNFNILGTLKMIDFLKYYMLEVSSKIQIYQRLLNILYCLLCRNQTDTSRIPMCCRCIQDIFHCMTRWYYSAIAFFECETWFQWSKSNQNFTMTIKYCNAIWAYLWLLAGNDAQFIIQN